MSGYYQGVIEVAPASLSAAKVEELAVTMTIQHLRHAGEAVTIIHDFLVDDLHADARLVSRYINCNADGWRPPRPEFWLVLLIKDDIAIPSVF